MADEMLCLFRSVGVAMMGKFVKALSVVLAVALPSRAGMGTLPMLHGALEFMQSEP